MEMRDHPLLASLKDEPAQIPANQPKVLRLDKSIVCQICKELFRGPVSITCGHSFCSEVSPTKDELC
jgi:E3 ubiquitin-protein ligase RAD18